MEYVVLWRIREGERENERVSKIERKGKEREGERWRDKRERERE